MGARVHKLTAKNPQDEDWQRGFTFIELLIVIGIFGLIAMIVFMAIPSLQRSGHNNSRRNDVAAILQAVGRYGLNNSANFPTSPTIFDNLKLAYYDQTAVPTQIVLVPGAAGVGPIAGVTNTARVEVRNYAKCDATIPGSAIKTGADYRDIVALYAVETASGSAPQCQQL